MQMKVAVDGLETLNKQLEALPRNVSRKILAGALRKAARPIANEARATAPVGPTGNLRRSFRVRAIRARILRRRGKAAGVSITNRNTASAPHAHLVEKGTGPRYTKSGRYTGIMPANPFMERAANKLFPASLSIVKTELSAGIKRALLGN